MPGRTLLLTGLRDLLRRPLHTGLMVLGIALGVSVVVAIDLANESARRAFERSSAAVGGRATHHLLGGPSGVPLAVYRELRASRSVSAAAPVVEAIGQSRALGTLRLLGVDPLAEAPFRDQLAGGSLREPGFASLMTSDGCVVGAALARRHSLALGGTVEVLVEGRQLQLRVLGLLEEPTREAESALDGLVLLDVGVLQRLLGLGDRVTRVELIASREEASALAARLAPGLRIAPAGEQRETSARLTEAFRLNLTALSLLALLVGMFLIYNTVTFSVVQRRAVFATLRALGVTPAQLFALILAETAAAAALGTLLGEGLGYLLGQGTVRLVTRTINDLYYVLAVREAPLQALSAFKGVVLGVGAGVLAAVAPALEAASVEPVTALRPSSYESGARRVLPKLAWAGAALAGAGALALRASETSLSASFGGLFVMVLGVALAVPLLTLALMALLGPALGMLAGLLGRLGARTVARAVSRTGVAIAALAIAVSVTIGVSLMIQSFRATVAEWLELALQADVYVSTPSGGGLRATPAFDRSMAQRVAAVEGVAAVATYRRVRVFGSLGEIPLGASDAAHERTRPRYRFADGSAADPWGKVLEGAVVASEPFAHRHRLPPQGASVTLRTDRGEASFPVVGIYYDYASEEGTLLMSRAVYDRYYDDRGVSSIAVYGGDGVPPAALTERVRGALAGTALLVTENARLKRAALRIFDRTFAVTEALRVLAVLVAFAGVWSALLSLQVERTRELATLQALGLLPGQLLRLCLVETGLMGLAAGLFSLPLGALLATVLVEVINVRSFGWTMRLQTDPWVFAQALALSVAASLAAAAYPLLRLRRMPLSAALRQE